LIDLPVKDIHNKKELIPHKKVAKTAMQKIQMEK
jgi:hypothetical protein